MTISLRLDEKTAKRLQGAAKSRGVTKSQFIRDLLSSLLAQAESPTPWELGKSVFGLRGSGRDNLSSDRKKILKEKLNAKQSSH